MPDVTITISDELHKRMGPSWNRMDISGVCEKALAKVTKHLERKSRDWPRGPVNLGGGEPPRPPGAGQRI
jgi:hypothetical protein